MSIAHKNKKVNNKDKIHTVRYNYFIRHVTSRKLTSFANCLLYKGQCASKLIRNCMQLINIGNLKKGDTQRQYLFHIAWNY